MRANPKVSNSTEKGFILPAVLAFIIAAAILGTALLTIILNNFFVVSNNVQSQQGFNIAEAGLNYYLWHMAHNGTDFKDGQTTPTTPDPLLGYGPYVHTYLDSNAQNAGTYTLWIKPAGSGSTIATVRSIGQATGSNLTRTVQAQIGAASFASYGLVSDSEFWFGSNETANGPVFSNVGVHMDGPNTDTVSSANASYTPGNNYVKYGSTPTQQNGVWCDTTVTSPSCNTRNKSNWLYPKTSIDFNQVSGSLCTIKKTAFADYSATSALANQANACTQTPTTRTNGYIPQYSSNGSFSTTQGYMVEFNSDGTYSLYLVSGENDRKATYLSALTLSAVSGASHIAIPPSGVIFVEDNVWVRTNTTFKGRVTIASGRLATNNSTTITIADNVLYSNKTTDNDAIGLIAEKDILVAPYAPPATGNFTFEVDAATLSQSGSVTYPLNYDGTNDCSGFTRGWTGTNQKLVFYGSVASRLAWTWNWANNGSCGDMVQDSASGLWYSGIKNTTTNYDYNLLYAPPPSYPITGSYNILSWREVLTHP
jgi:hypothetical protein